MKKLICANQATYDVCEETVCYPSGSANARNYLELWLPQDAVQKQRGHGQRAHSNGGRRRGGGL